MGHSSTKMLEQVYARLAPGVLHTAIATIATKRTVTNAVKPARALRYLGTLHEVTEMLENPAKQAEFPSAPEATRTPDRRLRRPLLYPTELRGLRCACTRR
jgi:hypothetical protein